MSLNESVLCIAREALPPSWLGKMTATPLSEHEFFDPIPAFAVRFTPRETAETDTSIKQIIPYLLIRTASGRFGCYQRRGTEERLHDLWSIGIGGHVSTADKPDHAGDLKDIIQNGLFREMREEFQPAPTSIPGFLGLINEEKTGVGSVHLGLVFCLDVDDPESITPGKELFRFCWATAEELADRKLEYWSQLALRLAG